MKKLISSFTQGMLLIAFTLVLTGCDELLYLKDNPVTPRLNVRSNSITVKVGETASCEASTQDHVALFYASADPAVATVDAKGIITGVAVGKTKVTVTAKGDDDYYRTQIFGENTQVIDVEVIDAKAKINVESVTLDKPTLTVTVGDAAASLTATVNPDNADDKTVTWKSSDETVATVADGVVTFVAAGAATITATATNGTADTADDKTATCVVTITAAAPSMLSTPLTMEAITAGTIKVTSPKSGMQYTLNGGAKTAVSTTAIDVAKGDKVAFYGNGTSIANYYGTKIAGGTAEVKVYGNIMSLVDETGFATNKELTAIAAFNDLFRNNAKLKDASGLLLPAETLTNNCYYGMFQGCTSLTTAPAELPAKDLANSCYFYMFYDCTALTAAPELKAEKLANYCCNGMFRNCTSLTTAPKLEAEALADFCYYRMFQGCTNLTTAPAELPAKTLKESCYKNMFQDCTSLATAPKLPATTLANSCYYSMFLGCTALTNAYVKAGFTTANDECTIMFDGCSATGAVLHTTTTSKTSWNGVWSNWTVEDNY